MRACLLFSFALLASPAAADPIDIKAERFELNQKAGSAVFEGDVRVVRGRLTLTCSRLQARYRDGRIESLSATGKVVVTGPDWVARANEAHYAQASGRLLLTGDPQIERGEDVLRGARVLVWPDEERLVVERARGTFRPPALKTPPSASP